jgi:hypothetical protein
MQGNQSNPKSFASYLEPYKILSTQNLIVLDTGFDGSVAEALGYVAREQGYTGNVTGLLLYKNHYVESTTKVLSLNNGEDPSLQRWAQALDENVLRGPDFSSPVFHRSSADAEKTKNDPAYKATILGLLDGLRQP